MKKLSLLYLTLFNLSLFAADFSSVPQYKFAATEDGFVAELSEDYALDYRSYFGPERVEILAHQLEVVLPSEGNKVQSIDIKVLESASVPESLYLFAPLAIAFVKGDTLQCEDGSMVVPSIMGCMKINTGLPCEKNGALIIEGETLDISEASLTIRKVAVEDDSDL